MNRQDRPSSPRLGPGGLSGSRDGRSGPAAGAGSPASDCRPAGLTGSADTLGLARARGVDLLRDLIHEETGVYFADNRKDVLADKLAGHVTERGCRSFLDYYYLLKYDPAGAGEWPHVMDALAVPETYFWREVDQIEAMVTELLPAFVVDHPGQPFRIWSAACCSGEEPLTIAMVLKEKGWLGRAPIRLVASDASPALIARAREGVYRERSFRALPPDLRDKYFRPVGDKRWQVDPKLREAIEYRVANLMDPATARLARAEAVFCRNVFIYFSPEAVRTVVERFHAEMPPGGHLFLGAAESLLRVTTAFDLRPLGRVLVYVKPTLPPVETTLPT